MAEKIIGINVETVASFSVKYHIKFPSKYLCSYL